MQVEQKIREKLLAAFAPERLDVHNDSQRHAHHTEARDASTPGESHFTVIIVSVKFAGRSRVERHRMVYQALDGEFAGGLHALAVKALTPEEAANAA